MRNTLLNRKLNARLDNELYGLKPAHRVDQQGAFNSDDLPYRIISGAVVIKPDVRRFTRTGVEFVDGTIVEEIDAVVYATGYRWEFPYVDHPALEEKRNRIDLY